MDKNGNVVLQLSRPIYLISSSIHALDGDGNQIGEIQMRWHLWRRKYDLYKGKEQFAHIDGNFLEWDFNMVDENGKFIASVNKDFRGLAKEIFTDANQYILRRDTEREESLEEKALTLATAIAIDYDYFSRHSRGGGFFPIFFPIPLPIPPTGGTASDSATNPVPEGATDSGKDSFGDSTTETSKDDDYWTFDKSGESSGDSSGGLWNSVKDYFNDS